MMDSLRKNCFAVVNRWRYGGVLARRHRRLDTQTSKDFKTPLFSILPRHSRRFIAMIISPIMRQLLDILTIFKYISTLS